jgi:3-hydroxyacyl-CoA dehydrogenase/enoyl-CoA hydratase/3-hydroxybutyryl-CoA epimerase
MLEFGMPMGPMRLLDEVGLDVALHVAESLAAAYSDRMNVPGCLRQMISAGLLGRKNGRGFYLHDKSAEAKVNPQASTFVQNQAARGLPREELPERMVLLMVNEAARCLEEQIVAGPQDVDFAMIMGTGFAPFLGGPLRYADSLGVDVVVGALENLVDRGVAHFEPCALLRKMAADRRGFYPKT